MPPAACHMGHSPLLILVISYIFCIGGIHILASPLKTFKHRLVTGSQLHLISLLSLAAYITVRSEYVLTSITLHASFALPKNVPSCDNHT